MRRWIKGLFTGRPSERHLSMVVQEQPSTSVSIEGHQPFDLVAHLYGHEGLPIPDWSAIERWVDDLPSSAQTAAWRNCVRGWLLHMRDSLGGQYALMQSKRALLVAPLEARQGAAALGFMESMMRRVLDVLPGIAVADPEWQPILIVLEDTPRYYDYISHVYREEGEYGFSGGMFLNVGPGHFVTTLEVFERMEPVIAHEMTHACLKHLDIPLWVDEGLAVNTERRLVGKPPSLYSPYEMHAKHLEFWTADTIQDFWSGKAFQRTDEGMMLAYDLASILVGNLAQEWKTFAAFVNAASHRDAGEWAARMHLHLELGPAVAAMFDKDPNGWPPKGE